MAKRAEDARRAAEVCWGACSTSMMPPLARRGREISLASITGVATDTIRVGSGKHALLLALINDVVQSGAIKWWDSDELLTRETEKAFLGCVVQRAGPFGKRGAVQCALPELKSMRLVAAKPNAVYDRNAKEVRKAGRDTLALTEAGVRVALALFDHHAELVAYQDSTGTPWAGSKVISPRSCARGAGAGGGSAGAEGGGRATAGGGAGAGGGDCAAAEAAEAAFKAATAAAEKARADALSKLGRLLLDDRLLFSLLTRLYVVAPRPLLTDAEVLTLDLNQVMATDKEGAILVKHAVNRGRLQPKNDGTVSLWPNTELPGLTAQDVAYAREVIFREDAGKSGGAAAGHHDLAGVKRPRSRHGS